MKIGWAVVHHRKIDYFYTSPPPPPNSPPPEGTQEQLWYVIRTQNGFRKSLNKGK